MRYRNIRTMEYATRIGYDAAAFSIIMVRESDGTQFEIPLATFLDDWFLASQQKEGV